MTSITTQNLFQSMALLKLGRSRLFVEIQQGWRPHWNSSRRWIEHIEQPLHLSNDTPIHNRWNGVHNHEGDYGWGMYLNGGQIGYASDYSLAKHPFQQLSFFNHGRHEIDLIENVGGEFRINGIPAGNISSQDAMIPQGEFGSNDCFIGWFMWRVVHWQYGAGCECNYFEEFLTMYPLEPMHPIHLKPFGYQTGLFWRRGGYDSRPVVSRRCDLRRWLGYAWRNHSYSGSRIVKRGIISNRFCDAGDQLLFYAGLDEMTNLLYFSLFGGWNFEKELVELMSILAKSISQFLGTWLPLLCWVHIHVWRMVMARFRCLVDCYHTRKRHRRLVLDCNLRVADHPTTGWNDWIVQWLPVTSQSVLVTSTAEDRTLYYYVSNEPLGSLSVETYGGTGNVNLGLSWGTVPDPFDQWFDAFEEENGFGWERHCQKWHGMVDLAMMRFTLTILNQACITSLLFPSRALDFTIKASFTYTPENIEQEDAIELRLVLPMAQSWIRWTAPILQDRCTGGTERISGPFRRIRKQLCLWGILKHQTLQFWPPFRNFPSFGDMIGSTTRHLECGIF